MPRFVTNSGTFQRIPAHQWARYDGFEGNRGNASAKLRIAEAVLIRSCDVYRELGIPLPDWVHRTEGFTRDVIVYEQARDTAYARMLSLLEEHVTAGSGFMGLCDQAGPERGPSGEVGHD